MKFLHKIKNKLKTTRYKFPNDIITDFHPLIIKVYLTTIENEFKKELELNKLYIIKDMPKFKIKIKQTTDGHQLFWIHILDESTTPNIWKYTSYVLFHTENQTLYNAYHKGQYPGFFTK